MKSILLTMMVLLGTVFAHNAIADDDYDLDFEITRIHFDLRLYEICGKVTGKDVTRMPVEIVPDNGTKHQGFYSTMANDDGNFCHLVRIIGNRVLVRLPNANKAISKELK